MDHDEMSNAYNRAKEDEDWWTKPLRGLPKNLTYMEGDSFSKEEQVDYAILHLGNSFIVARSRFLGSLDYTYVCTCDSHYEASLIVKGLSK